MSNIQDLLAQILAARYGRDVRQSIHDAIETCYDDGHAGAIDLQAREDISALDGRMDTAEGNITALQNEAQPKAELNPTAYSSSTISATSNISLVSGGYVKMGKLVTVNLKVNIPATGYSTAKGFPKPNSTNIAANVAFTAKANTAYIDSDGVLRITSTQTGEQLVSATYLSQ